MNRELGILFLATGMMLLGIALLHCVPLLWRDDLWFVLIAMLSAGEICFAALSALTLRDDMMMQYK